MSFACENLEHSFYVLKSFGKDNSRLFLNALFSDHVIMK